jgi:hypothetical protein
VTALLYCAWCVGWLLGDACAAEAGAGYLYRPAYCLDEALRLPAEPYLPQPGDIAFSTDRRLFWHITFSLAFAGHPHHCGVVFRKPDGRLALLEAGPHDTAWVEVLDLAPHLRSYEAVGRVWVRRRQVPLTCEQSAALTAFALAQDGKRFAIVRLGGQLTPLRSRGPLRTYVLGRPRSEYRTFFCAELAMATCLAAGLLDPATTRPSATYPRDFFLDRSLNLYNNRHLCLAPDWFPPQRWTSCPVEPCPGGGCSFSDFPIGDPSSGR